jgi:hypothetical protein
MHLVTLQCKCTLWLGQKHYQNWPTTFDNSVQMVSANIDTRICVQGNETSPIGRDPWESLDVKADIAFLAIELVDTKESTPRTTEAASAQYAAALGNEAAAAAAAGDEASSAMLQQQVEVLARAPTRLKLRWNNTGNVEVAEGQADNTAEASSIIPHVNTPGMLFCYMTTFEFECTERAACSSTSRHCIFLAVANL